MDYQIEQIKKEQCEELATFLAKANRKPEQYCCYIGTEQEEILGDLEELLDEIPKAILCIREQGKISMAIVGDVCEDNENIEVWGPFWDEEKYENEWIEKEEDWSDQVMALLTCIQKRQPTYKLAFFIGKHNLVARVITRNGAKMNSNHTIMRYDAIHNQSDRIQEQQDPLTEQSIEKADPSVLRIVQLYPNTSENTKKQIISLHDSLFKGSYYNGNTIVQMIDEKHLLHYGIIEDEVVCYVFEQYEEEQEGYIEFIGTKSSHRRKGYAEALLNQVKEQMLAKEYASLRLCVNSENIAAIHLYEKMGYHIIEENVAYDMQLIPC
ncbi:GNAT family N-acetyltransferase [Anaerosporobacter faecicola]|uniref:GNAT family N-acetyltransferase n=1 Tax=Anaerosporobacter faecicola TaxID=2718714 RepID=UPI00143C012E|nr:GNAT family N-acetyltransferase [Anaerosporobacter faecicola]